MKQYRYKSYQEYVNAQRAGYAKKKDKVWARSENIAAIAEHIAGCETGICHGVRGGQEVEWFRVYLNAQVVGTEIGDTDAPHVTQWDFNKAYEPWAGAFDFVYSNAFDHAYEPRETLKIWWAQVAEGGYLVIETDERNEHTGKVSKPVNPTDPTGMTLNELVECVTEVTGAAVELLPLPVVTYGYRKAVIARRI